MLREQLIPALALLAITCVAPAEVRMQDLEQAQAAAADARARTRATIGQAEDLMAEGAGIRKAIRQIAGAGQAPLGRIGGIRPGAPSINLDALMQRQAGKIGTGAQGPEQLLVFISDAVPRASLRRLARQAAAVGAPLVLRGVVGDGFVETAAFMRDILGEEEPKARALIDPTLFARFEVRQAPAVILAPDGACIAGIRACPKATPAHVHVAGDVTLDYALDYIARTHPDHRAVARTLLTRLGGAP